MGPIIPSPHAPQPSALARLSLRDKLLLAQAVHEIGATPPDWGRVSALLLSHPLIRQQSRIEAAASAGLTLGRIFGTRECERAWTALMRQRGLVLSKDEAGGDIPPKAKEARGAQPRMDKKAQLSLAQLIYAERIEELKEHIKEKEQQFKNLIKEIDDIKSGNADARLEMELRIELENLAKGIVPNVSAQPPSSTSSATTTPKPPRSINKSRPRGESSAGATTTPITFDPQRTSPKSEPSVSATNSASKKSSEFKPKKDRRVSIDHSSSVLNGTPTKPGAASVSTLFPSTPSVTLPPVTDTFKELSSATPPVPPTPTPISASTTTITTTTQPNATVAATSAATFAETSSPAVPSVSRLSPPASDTRPAELVPTTVQDTNKVTSSIPSASAAVSVVSTSQTTPVTASSQLPSVPTLSTTVSGISSLPSASLSSSSKASEASADVDLPASALATVVQLPEISATPALSTTGVAAENAVEKVVEAETKLRTTDSAEGHSSAICQVVPSSQPDQDLPSQLKRENDTRESTASSTDAVADRDVENPKDADKQTMETDPPTSATGNQATGGSVQETRSVSDKDASNSLSGGGKRKRDSNEDEGQAEQEEKGGQPNGTSHETMREHKRSRSDEDQDSKASQEEEEEEEEAVVASEDEAEAAIYSQSVTDETDSEKNKDSTGPSGNQTEKEQPERPNEAAKIKVERSETNVSQTQDIQMSETEVEQQADEKNPKEAEAQSQQKEAVTKDAVKNQETNGQRGNAEEEQVSPKSRKEKSEETEKKDDDGEGDESETRVQKTERLNSKQDGSTSATRNGETDAYPTRGATPKIKMEEEDDGSRLASRNKQHGSTFAASLSSTSKRRNRDSPTVKEDPEREKGRRKMVQVLLMLLTEVSNHTHGNLFHNPIKEQDAPDYYTLVKQPLDIKTIKARIKEGSISTASQLRRALNQMFANSLIYNRPGTEVHRMASEMSAASEEIMNRFELTQNFSGRR